MAGRGPVPKRSDRRLGHRAKAEREAATSAPGAAVVSVPAAVESWHPLARDWFDSLAASGQSAYYEPSDWAQARVWAQVLSGVLSSARPSAQMVAAWQTGAAELLTTEGARRRVRLELQRVHGVDVGELHNPRRSAQPSLRVRLLWQPRHRRAFDRLAGHHGSVDSSR